MDKLTNSTNHPPPSIVINDTAKLELIVRIAHRAIELHSYQANARIKKQILREAYADWKASRGLNQMEDDSPEYAQMMGETDGLFQNFQYAQRHEKNARKRLQSAICSFHHLR